MLIRTLVVTSPWLFICHDTPCLDFFSSFFPIHISCIYPHTSSTICSQHHIKGLEIGVWILWDSYLSLLSLHFLQNGDDSQPAEALCLAHRGAPEVETSIGSSLSLES